MSTWHAPARWPAVPPALPPGAVLHVPAQWPAIPPAAAAAPPLLRRARLYPAAKHRPHPSSGQTVQCPAYHQRAARRRARARTASSRLRATRSCTPANGEFAPGVSTAHASLQHRSPVEVLTEAHPLPSDCCDKRVDPLRFEGLSSAGAAAES
eukprot:2410404-Prymnesium_polylepis.2